MSCRNPRGTGLRSGQEPGIDGLYLCQIVVHPRHRVLRGVGSGIARGECPFCNTCDERLDASCRGLGEFACCACVDPSFIAIFQPSIPIHPLNTSQYHLPPQTNHSSDVMCDCNSVMYRYEVRIAHKRSRLDFSFCYLVSTWPVLHVRWVRFIRRTFGCLDRALLANHFVQVDTMDTAVPECYGQPVSILLHSALNLVHNLQSNQIPGRYCSRDCCSSLGMLQHHCEKHNSRPAILLC